MALDIPDEKEEDDEDGFFLRRDVRETPASTATATAVGLTDPLYLTLALDADLTNERVLTAGEGIDFTDAGANSTLTIKGKDASTTNKGIAKFSAGAGMDVSDAAGTITYAGEDSSAGNKGIVIVAGTANKITVSYGAGTATLSLTNKTSYWSATGIAFIGVATALTGGAPEGYTIPGAQSTICPVYLPHGAIVTGAVVYGSDTGNTWTLFRFPHDDVATSVTMATAVHDTEDTTITSATIDNSGYRYFLHTTVGAGDTIVSARIKYTTDYD